MNYFSCWITKFSATKMYNFKYSKTEIFLPQWNGFRLRGGHKFMFCGDWRNNFLDQKPTCKSVKYLCDIFSKLHEVILTNVSWNFIIEYSIRLILILYEFQNQTKMKLFIEDSCGLYTDRRAFLIFNYLSLYSLNGDIVECYHLNLTMVTIPWCVTLQ